MKITLRIRFVLVVIASLFSFTALLCSANWAVGGASKDLKARDSTAKKPADTHIATHQDTSLAVPTVTPANRLSRELPKTAPLTLWDNAGRLSHPISTSEQQIFVQSLQSLSTAARDKNCPPARKASLNRQAAQLHVYLGEKALDADENPTVALAQFHAAQALITPACPVYGVAAFDSGVVLERQGAYAEAEGMFDHLLALKSKISGVNVQNCSRWLQAARRSAGFHEHNRSLGIPEPPRTDPQCAAAALAVVLRAHNLTYDKATALSRLHVTGLGSGLPDIAAAINSYPALRARAIGGDLSSLKSLPKPLFAHVEDDHWIAVTGADDKGVTFLCGDCGQWPGGKIHLTWHQWVAMKPGLFVTVTSRGSWEDRLISAVLERPVLGVQVASKGRFAPGARSGRRVALPPLGEAYEKLAGHIIGYGNTVPSAYCGAKRGGLNAGGASSGYAGGRSGSGGLGGNSSNASPGAGGPGSSGSGTGSSGTDGTGGTGGTGGMGPSSPAAGDPVNLTTGQEEYSPNPDLTVYNPNGVGVSWRRIYMSLNGGADWGPESEFMDFGRGWANGYHSGVYDTSMAIAPHVPQGGTGTFLATSSGGTTGGTNISGTVYLNDWAVYQIGTSSPIATSYNPNGWGVSNTAHSGGVSISVSAPSTATTTTSSRIYGYGYQVVVNASHPVFTYFDVTSSGSASGPVTTSGAKYLYTSDGREISFSAPSVPTAASPTVVCAVENGMPIYIEWRYTSATDQAGYYYIRFADGTQWITEPANAIVSCYPLRRILNRMGQGLSFQYGLYATEMPWPLIDSISDDSSNTTLLTVSRASDGFVNSVSDNSSRTVSYTRVVTGSWPYPCYLTQVTMPYVGTPPSGSPRYQYSYWSYLVNFDGSNHYILFLQDITVPSPTGTGTSTMRLFYDSSTFVVTEVNYPLGNYQTFTPTDSTHTRVTTYRAGNHVIDGYAIQFDNLGNTVACYNNLGNQYYSAQYGGSNPYAPATVAVGNSIPAPGQLTPGGSTTFGPTGTSGSPYGYYTWQILLSGTQIDFGNDGSSGSGGWSVSYNTSNHLFTVHAPGSAAASTAYTVKWKGYLSGTGDINVSATFGVATFGATTQYTYDQFGNILTGLSRRSVLTQYTYDYSVIPTGRLTSLQVGSKPASTFTYDDTHGGLLASATTAAPYGSGVTTVTTSYQYDSLGNVTQVTSPGNNATSSIVTTFNYTTDGTYTQAEAVGQPLVITDNLGHSIHFRYDAQGNTVSTWDALGNQYDRTYNVLGQLQTVLFPATGQTGTGRGYTQYSYLYYGGPLSQVSLYDESGSLVRQIQATLNAGGATTGVSGAAETVSASYDAGDRLGGIADGRGSTTVASYDSSGALTGITYPGGDTLQVPTFDQAGDATQTIDGNSAVVNYTYSDPEDLLTDVSYPATSSRNIHITYDSYGRVASRSDGTGTQSYSYGNLDELVSVTTTYTGLPARTISYTYYPNGSRASMTTPAGTFTYTYDADGRPVGLTNPFSETTQWDYYDNGQLFHQYDDAIGFDASYGYNALGQVNAVNNWYFTGSFAEISKFINITYDGAGNRTAVHADIAVAPGLGGDVTYTYDTKNRLTQEGSTRYPSFTDSWAYDGAGNPTTFGGYSLTYNSNNQRTGSGFTFDGNGNPTSYSGATLAFNADNELTAVGSALTADYTASCLRAWKQNGSGTRTYFLYDGATPIIEMDNTGAVTATNTFGANGLISRNTTGLASGSVFYLYDERGNVAERMNASGTVTSHDVVGAYGQIKWSNLSGNDPFGFGAQFGYYTDRETGLILCGLRYYDAGAGRWLTRDPASYGGGMNLYAYCDDNPVMGIDPSGLRAGAAQGGLPKPPGAYDEGDDLDLGSNTTNTGNGLHNGTQSGQPGSKHAKQAMRGLETTLATAPLSAATGGLGAEAEAVEAGAIGESATAAEGAETAGDLVRRLLPKDLKDALGRAFQDNSKLADISEADREAAASAYDQIAGMTVNNKAGLAKLYNLERAKFLRGQVDHIAGTANAFGEEIGYKP